MDLISRGTGPARPEPADTDAKVVTAPLVLSPRVRSRWRGIFLAVVAVGVLLRFATWSHLWLDEALTLNIARLPLGDLTEALRHDGAPPLYYVLLHGWTVVFGTSTLAVRILPGLFAVLSLPLVWMAARRLGGPRVAWAATLLLATSPFAIRYATEARQYSLVMVLVLLGFLAVLDLVDGQRTRQATAGLAVVTGLALLTHYWTFYLLAVAVVALALVARRGTEPARSGARRAVVAMGLGTLLFLPWVPSFLYQLGHTGTPWGRPGTSRAMWDTVTHFAGGYWEAGIPLGLLYFGLIVLAVFGWAVDGRQVLLDLRGRSPGRWLAAVTFGTLAFAIVAGRIGGSAFAVRYAAVLYPLFVILVALGTDAFASRRVFGAVMAVAVGYGLWGSVPNLVGERTSAARVASALEAKGSPGDVVAYCPDQLGPSVSRELDAAGLVQLTLPRFAAPQLVDWVDYEKVNRAFRPADTARALLARAGPDHDLWVVWAPGYRTYGTKCQNLIEHLEKARPANERVVKVSTRYFERPGLVRFRPGTAG